ncbi:MAG: maleylpyruvate isomerase family mycothiol-dependent enzyme [Acidimicrobiia bacterium]|nr:maleylpyruvate isomerase family mycothiol-dependent enzyme [Acidimicrobiia bacterium]
MDYEEHVATIETEGRALTAAAESVGTERDVPSCPGWTVGTLLGHVGGAHRWAAAIVGRRSQEVVDFRELERPPDGPARIAWVREGITGLLSAFAEVGPDATVWTWAGHHPSAWWARRMAHETAVHRWDAELAAGTPRPLDGQLAVDGIDEQLANVSARSWGKVTGAGETMHLHCTDREGEWLVRFEPDDIVVERVHAKGDVAVRGTASDLLLLLWGRRRPGELEVFGDAAIVERWQEQTRI